MVSYFFYKTMLMNIMMLSLGGEGCGDFHFLVHLCMLSFLLLLKEKAYITFIIRIKYFLWGEQTKNLCLFLLHSLKIITKFIF